MADQEEDCDSLDQILRMISRNDEVNRSYSSSGQLNHASSIGVGRRISAVVDPEFRLPSTIPSTTQTDHTNQSNEMFNPPFGNNNQHPGSDQQAQNESPNPNVVHQGPSLESMVHTNDFSSGYTIISDPNHQQIGGQMPMQTSMAPSIGIQANRLGVPSLSNQLPVSGNLSVPSGTVPFAVQGAPNTFQSLARRPPQTSGFAPMNIMSSTLHDYGPPVIRDPQRGRGFVPHLNYIPPTSRPHQTISTYPMGPAPLSSVSLSAGPARPASTSSVVPNYDSRPMGPAPLGYAPAVQQRSNTAPPNNNFRKDISPPPPPPPEPAESGNQTGTSSSSNISKSLSDSTRPCPVPATRPSSSGPQSDGIIYSAPLTTRSPPLDKIVNHSGQPNTDKQPIASMTNSGRIPKVQAPKNKDNYDGMTLTELQQRFRDYEFDIQANNKRLESIERALNDLTRSAKGRNIELDPEFKRLQSEKIKHKEDALRLRNCLNKIDEKLYSKFRYKMNPKEAKSAKPIPSRKAPPKRAKMSTTSQNESSATDSNRGDRVSLELKDCNTWCEICNEHFESLGAYCDHLHSRDHKRCMPKSNPWANSSKQIEKLSQKQTLAQLKSICSKISDTLAEDNFDLRDLDRVLNYTIDDRDTVLKVRFLERERGKVDEEDPLFQYKGYDYLVPISGFYCNLCSKALCDNQEVERHMTSYNHNVAHIKSVALNRNRERTFRLKMAKSHKEIFGEKPKLSPKKSKNQSVVVSEVERESSQSQPGLISKTSSTISAESGSTAPQYKKLTSHIVDQHEAVIEKFPTVLIDNKRKRQPDDELARKKVYSRRQEASTAIMPLGDMSRPTALKRLKKSTRPLKSKPIIESSDDSDVDIGKNKVEPKKTKTRPVIINDDDEQTAIESHDSDVEFLKEVHLDRGDPDSPFPDLELSVTGNIHVSALKDTRLSAKCSVKLKMLKLDDYKHMLLDSASIWARLSHLVAKKERVQQEIGRPRPTFFDVDGNQVPVEIEDDGQGSQNESDRNVSNRKGQKGKKVKDGQSTNSTRKEEERDSYDDKTNEVRGSKIDDKPPGREDQTRKGNADEKDKDKGGPEVTMKDEDKSESKDGFMQQMELLEAFFCEK